MSDSEPFLSRWARRKSIAGQKPDKSPDKPAEPASQATEAGVSGSAAKALHESKAGLEQPPVFDPASLPSLDSIGADSDIGAFLKPGVPSDLRHAALRRAWAADPAIRDFKGLQENDWNFNDPNGIPGFGPLNAGTDVKKMVEQLFGTPPTDVAETDAKNDGDAAAQPAATKVADDTRPERDVASDSAGAMSTVAPEKVSLRRNDDIATHNDDVATTDTPPSRRRSHGGALPH